MSSDEATQPTAQPRIVAPLPNVAREMDPALVAALAGGPMVHTVGDTPGMPTQTFRDLTAYYSREIAELKASMSRDRAACKAEIAELRDEVSTLQSQRTGIMKAAGSVALELVKDPAIKAAIATSITWVAKVGTVGGSLALLIAVGVTQLTYKDGTLSFTSSPDIANEERAEAVPIPEPVTLPPELGTSPDL